MNDTRTSIGTAPPALLIAEDKLRTRLWLQEWAEREFPRCRIFHAGSSDDARRVALAHRPTVALVDIDMREALGFEILRLLSAIAPGIQLIAVSMFHAEAYRDYAAGAGARTCLSLATSDSKLKEAVRALMPSPRAVGPEPRP